MTTRVHDCAPLFDGEEMATQSEATEDRTDFSGTLAIARGLSRGALRRALFYIEANLGETFTLNDLANAAGVSRFHFARLFRISTGMSPMGFLRYQRIKRAQRLLLERQATISSIATMLGFCDQSHFTRSFKRVTGKTPRGFVSSRNVTIAVHSVAAPPFWRDDPVNAPRIPVAAVEAYQPFAPMRRTNAPPSFS